jgi:hypothetical protein
MENDINHSEQIVRTHTLENIKSSNNNTTIGTKRLRKKTTKKNKAVVCFGCCYLYKKKMCLRKVVFIHSPVQKNTSISGYQAADKANKKQNCKFKSFAFWKTFYLQFWCRKKDL